MTLPKNTRLDLTVLLQAMDDLPANLQENLVGIYLWGSLSYGIHL